MSDTWKLWEGETVNGKFPLVRYLGGSEPCAVFLTERREGDRLVKAAIKLIPAAPEFVELQLARWRQAAELSHPHLISLYEMGRLEVRGAPLVYAVMEWAEENLAQVLPDRALTLAEAREMLESVLDALAYLHGNGFVHGHIKPANIMASGEQLKISGDGLRRSGELLAGLGDQNAYDPPEMARGILPMSQATAPAGDVWSLGMALVEGLTQNLPVVRTEEQQDPLFPQSLPEPFLDITRHCLIRHPERRWTVAQIAARLKGRAPMPGIQDISSKVQAPLPAPVQKPIARQSIPPAKLRSYAVPVAVGLVLVLTAILAGPKLIRRHTEASQVPAATGGQPLVPPAPSQSTPPSQDRQAKAYGLSGAEEGGSPKVAVQVSATSPPDRMREEETKTVAELPAGSMVHGEVAQQIMPEVLQSARNSIQGKVRVSVKVNVDRSGDVEDAELESQGPSKYFARAALNAAKDWKFKPPTVGGQGVLSSWTLRFEFTRNETTVVPKQEMP